MSLFLIPHDTFSDTRSEHRSSSGTDPSLEMVAVDDACDLDDHRRARLRTFRRPSALYGRIWLARPSTGQLKLDRRRHRLAFYYLNGFKSDRSHSHSILIALHSQRRFHNPLLSYSNRIYFPKMFSLYGYEVRLMYRLGRSLANGKGQSPYPDCADSG